MIGNTIRSFGTRKILATVLRATVGAAFILTLIFVVTINLESAPPVWWDEGWTMSVARNWVERGVYTRLLAGEPTQPGMEAHFPVTASIALSFRLLGVGIWQARLVGLIFTLGALTVIYFLTMRLYDRKIALATVTLLLFMSPRPAFHPFIMGRQVMGEMPMVFYLLSGYFFLFLALQKSKWYLVAAVPFLALALATKAQTLPFLLLSLFLPICVAIYCRRWSIAGVLFIALTGSFLIVDLFKYWNRLLLADSSLATTAIPGLYSATALVMLPLARKLDVLAGLVWVLPTILGILYVAPSFMEKCKISQALTEVTVVRLSLWILVGSWFGWFIILSVGWERHLFPAVFTGSMFAAAMLKDVTDNFSLQSTVARASSVLTKLRFNKETCAALLAIVLITYTATANGKMLYRVLYEEADQSVLEVAAFLNTQTAPVALIEIFDTELYFLLNRRYHYPPDQTNVELIRQIFLRQNVPINYDPLAADPDYLVVGPHSKMLHLYDYILSTGAFRPLRNYGRYVVYERVR